VHVADGGDEGAHQPQELVPGHALVLDRVEHAVQPAVEGQPATAVQVRVGVRVLDDARQLSCVLEQLRAAERAGPVRGGDRRDRRGRGG
jgi:hypothetical protein